MLDVDLRHPIHVTNRLVAVSSTKVDRESDPMTIRRLRHHDANKGSTELSLVRTRRGNRGDAYNDKNQNKPLHPGSFTSGHAIGNAW